MLDGTNAGRARLFENLRNDHIADVTTAEAPKGLRIEPLTPAQAEAFCEMAMRSLKAR